MPAAKRHEATSLLATPLYGAPDLSQLPVHISNNKLPDAADNFFSPQNTAFYAAGVYTVLDHHMKEIRLLNLLPGSAEDQVRCNIAKPTPMTDCAGQYEALSYCAGDPSETICIKVSGLDFNVFASLDQGLRRLRRTKKPRLVWIDQICINQDDLAERAFQVQLMGDVYADATRGVVWMGPLPDEKLVVQQIEFLDERLHEELARRKKILMRGSNDREMQLAYQTIGADRGSKEPGYTRFEAWSALVSLIAAPVWTRCWIAQEIVRAPKVIVYGATAAFDLDLCWPVYDATLTHLQGKTDFHYNPEVLKAGNRMELLRIQEQCLPSQLGRFCAARRERLVNRQVLSPRVALRTARLASSTDPRDRVYAFIGLMKPNLSIVPNYHESNTAENAYLDACCAFIMSDKSLSFLTEGQELERSSASPLPSWSLTGGSCRAGSLLPIGTI